MIARVFPIPKQRRTNTDPVGPYLDALTVCRLGLLPPAEVEELRDDVPGFADGFDPYREQLAAAGAIDFDEQIYGALEALLRDGAFRRRVQREHRHLLVDEFQDLTPAHVLMIRLLAMPGFDVFGVGDDDQTIYDHAGADPRFLVDYAELLPRRRGRRRSRSTTAARRRSSTAPRSCSATTACGCAKTIRPAAGRRSRPGRAGDPHPAGRRGGGDARRARPRLAVGAGRRPRGRRRPRPRQLAAAGAAGRALFTAGVPVASAVRGEMLERTGTAAALAWLRVAVDPENLIGSDLEAIRRRPSRGFPIWISKWLANCRSLDDLRRRRAADRRRARRRQGRRDGRRHRDARRARGGRRPDAASCSRRSATGSASAGRWRCSTARRAARRRRATSTTSRA